MQFQQWFAKLAPEKRATRTGITVGRVDNQLSSTGQADIHRLIEERWKEFLETQYLTPWLNADALLAQTLKGLGL
jgi:hypothetical protein